MTISLSRRALMVGGLLLGTRAVLKSRDDDNGGESEVPLVEMRIPL